MDELVFNDGGISFKYLSNWREQKKEMKGNNCIKSLVRVFDGEPASITIYKNTEELVSVDDLQEPMLSAFKSQGWNIINSQIANINNVHFINIVANSEQGDKVLELHTFSTLNNGFMYIFELITFEGSKFAINDFLAILDSFSFED